MPREREELDRRAGRQAVKGDGAAAVLLDVGAYEALVERAELLEDIRVAEAEIKAGKEIPHSEVKAELLARFKR